MRAPGTREHPIGDGPVILVEPATNEQGWATRTAGKDRWYPIDFDGPILSARIRRQNPISTSIGPAPAGIVPSCRVPSAALS
ncbi:type I-E CRISPR-associated endoribonuclease Cas2 [Nonomuraea sp. CA-141351]|uniref:type I-E CRISPR-associated endoribonuclease Cas2 n=1 Tax=Nonomuraea sp. CA-141351 TaxID=3239996 RepID=UPI003D89D1FC